MSEGRLIKNKLRIVRQVGRGGMGYVYEAFHEGLRVTRALKQIVGDLQDNPDIERRFLHEAQMMARLEHPHIVRVFDIDQEPDFGTYLLMEFIRGRDLGEMLRQEGRFSYPETLRIGIAVASALDCAHRAGLVHRDIKPANILIEDGTGRPVVTDFGIAKEVESAGDESFTRTGSFVGTYRYSSREQIRSEKGVPIDGRADVYSLGVVLYEIYAGRKYLAGMPELKIASCVGYQDDWLPALDYPEPPPPNFVALLDECIAPDRDKRIRSAADLVRRLEECRRLDLLAGAGSGADQSVAAMPLAASPTSATTQTAPSPWQSAGLGELTATTLEEPQRQQTVNETRSQWVGLLQGLRGAVDDQAGEFERLLKELIELDIPRDDFRQLDDMSQILSRVERAESAGQYQDAASNLQGLSDRIQQLNGRIEQTLAEAIERNAGEINQAWRELAVGAGDILPGERTRAFEQLLAPVADLLEAGDWIRARETLRDARGQLEQVRRDTRAVATERVAGVLRELQDGFAVLQERSPAAAAASAIDPAALARELDGAIEQGALTAALRGGADAVRAVREATQRLDQEEQARVQAARTAADGARAALDLAETAELAEAELQAADAARAAAEALAGRGELPAAATGFERASALYARLAESVRSAGAAQIAAARQALVAASAQVEGAPDEVVGEARRTAQRLLDGNLPRERAAAIQVLREAGDALGRALAEVGPFSQARDGETAARAALDRATVLGASTADLTPAQRILQEAAASRARREFAAARDGFARAAAAADEIGGVVVARGEAERLAATRAQIDESLSALDSTLAGELCAAEIERALRAREAADAAERAGDRGSALVASSEALGALREASQALLAGLGERSGALANEVRGLAARAGDLLAASPRTELERAVQGVERALVQRDARVAAAALDDGWRRVGDARVELDERTRGLASAALVQIRGALGALAAAEPEAAGASGVDPEALAGVVDTLLGEERFGDARTAATDAVARVQGALDTVRRGQRDAVGAAREAAAAARQRIDVAAAREVAAPELAQADALFAAAERASAEEDLAGAVRGYGEAAAAARALQAEVRARQIGGFEAERAALEELLTRAADAPDEIIGSARGEARALVEATVSGDLRQASSAVQKSRATLEKLLAEAEQFSAARAQQVLARQAEQRVTALSPSRKQLKAPANALRDADAVFARKTWPAAADAYAKATQGWSALENELNAALAQERAVVQAKAEADARAAAEKKQAADATVLGDVDATVLGAPDVTRIERSVPKAETRSGLPVAALAGGAALLVAAASLALWLSQRDATPPPVTTAKVEEPRPKSEANTEPRTEPKAATKLAVPDQPKQAVAPPVEEPVATAQAQAVQPEPVPKEEPAQVANVAPPSPIAPPPLRISGFTPDAAEVTVKEGAKQAFSVTVAGGLPGGTKPKIAWRLGDRVVANDVARWEYAPGFDTASDAPRDLAVTIGEGADAQTRSWRVAVANVNRKPQLVTAPKAGGKIDAKLGDTVKLSANVKDEDGDPIKYAWKIDGKAVANDAAQLEVPVTGDRAVSVTASDGSADVSASWQIAAIKPVLRLDATPARLERLRFEKPQEFALSVPPGTSGLELEWTVDGKKVASGPRFTFANVDPSKVRRAPVQIAVSARDAQGSTFERKWDVVVEPPAPQVTDTTPAPGTIDAAAGDSRTFELAAGSPIGGQDLTYVFQVDGRQAAKGKSPSFQYRVGDDDGHRITGFVQDNFDQASAKTEWSIPSRVRPGPPTGTTAPTGDIQRSAQSWLDEYQSAFNGKDASRLGQLRGLSPDKVAELQKVLNGQEDLRVTFSDVRIDRIDDQKARITYTRTDDFTDARGTPVSRTGTVEQVVGLVNGRLTELETRRR